MTKSNDNDDSIFENLWVYLKHKLMHTDNGYEWRELCGLIDAIENRRPRYYQILNNKFIREQLINM